MESKANASENTNVKVSKLQKRWYEAHSIAGMVVLLPLFIILCCGTVSFFREPLKAWHTPDIWHGYEPVENHQSGEVVNHILSEAPKDINSIIVRGPVPDAPITKVEYKNKKETVVVGVTSTGEVIPNERLTSKVAQHIYKWHYLDPLPQGRIIAGIVALIWLALTISGFYIHRQKLLSQFKRKKRTGNVLQSWLHTIIATIMLPFHLIYGVTGVFFNLSIIALPVTMLVSFQGDQEKMMEHFNGLPADPKPSGEVVSALPDIQPFIKRANEEIQDENLHFSHLSFSNPYDENGVLNVRYYETPDSGKRTEVKFLPYVSDEPIAINRQFGATGVREVLRPVLLLHFGDYEGFWKLLYVIMGVSLCVLTTAGARLYIKRKARELPRWTKYFERIFDGFGLGIIPAIAIFALSNRLLPHSLNKGALEMQIFHVSWVIIGLAILIIGTGKRQRNVLYYSALLGLFCIPWLDGVLLGAWPWSDKLWTISAVAKINWYLLILLPFIGILHIYVKMKISKNKPKI